jgi:endonuclease/exonuclease/phosphatase family metal-dependent hydrolase
VVVALMVALRVRTALVAAALCCAGYGLVIAPVVASGPHPSPTPDGPRLRVMTLNIDDDGADPAAVVRAVRDREVDVLAVQELSPGFHARLVDAGLDELLPFTAAGDPPGALGSGIYSRHPLGPVVDEVDGKHDNPTVPVAVDGAPPVEVTVVHPVSPVSGAERADWRRTLATLPRPTDDGPVRVLAGDFNATVDQPSMQEMLDDGYVDAAGAVGDGWIPTWQRGMTPPLVIDHVLVDRATAVDRVAVVGIPGTDHKAVVADLRLPAA